MLSKTGSSNPFLSHLKFCSDFFETPEKLSKMKADFLASSDFHKIQFGFQTLSTRSYFDLRSEQQWNPFSQRLLLQDMTSESWLSRDPFDQTYTASIGIAESVHELFHILLWEPVLCGQESVNSLDDFIELSLIFEAFCYWYGEIIFTRKVKLLYPDQGLVFGQKSSATSPHFHPKRVFQNEGIHNTNEMLEIYLVGFRGYKSKLNKFKTPAGQFLKDIIYGFHYENEIALRRYYSRLKEIGIFGRFWTDFCQGSNEIAAYDVSKFRLGKILESPSAVRKILPLLTQSSRKLNAQHTQSIRLRRDIQTRAYFLLSDLNLVQESRLLNRETSRPLNLKQTKLLKCRLELGLDRLKLVYNRLINRQSNHRVSADLFEADQFCQKIYNDFGPLTIMNQFQIYPNLDLPRTVGLVGAQAISPKELLQSLTNFKKIYLEYSEVKHNALKEIEKLQTQLQVKGLAKDLNSFTKIKNQYNKLIIKHGKRPTLHQDFLNKNFNENNFIYR